MRLPASLLALGDRGPSWAAWLDRLPALLRDLVVEWELVVDGELVHGNTAVVVPVRLRDSSLAVLKVGWPHPEAEHEALALQHWHGRGAVRLLRADPRRWALLLERLEHRDLAEEWDVAACEIVGGLYPDLHVPAPPQLARLSAVAARWADDLGAADLPVPRRLVEQARSLARDLAADPATDGVLVHGDLHFHNVLAVPGATAVPADGGGWRAIDPKPLSGDPHVEPAPLLWNRWSELAGDVRGGVRRRFHAVVDAGGLDEDRAREWVIVRTLAVAMQEATTNAVPDRDWITALIATAKAVQD